MNERTARDVVLVRAIETADGGREVWSDADRVWAGRTAAEIVGATAPADAFLGRRAALALERLAERYPKAHVRASVPALRGWLAPLALLIAFVVGAAGVDIGPRQRINLLAPPLLGLLVWNLAVYVALVLAVLRQRSAVSSGPLRQRVAAWFRDVSRPQRKSMAPRPLALALAQFAVDWSILAAPLWHRRAARLLHACAAVLAAGAIAALYLRGIALEFRAGWESTFLDAADVARLLHVVLAPGSWLTGIAIPGATRLQTLGPGSAGENAAPWIHLYAATILLLVILPRLVLAGAAWYRVRRLAQHFPMPLDHGYFLRLLQAWREGAVSIVAIPYSYDVSPVSAAGLAKVMARVFQSAVDIRWRPAIPYGEDRHPDLGVSPLAGVVVVFNLSATPERENHGAFVAALGAACAGLAPLIALVDTSDFVTRFEDQPRRIAERQAAWQELLAAQAIDPLFVRLAEPDLSSAATALATRLERVTP